MKTRVLYSLNSWQQAHNHVLQTQLQLIFAIKFRKCSVSLLLYLSRQLALNCCVACTSIEGASLALSAKRTSSYKHTQYNVNVVSFSRQLALRCHVACISIETASMALSATIRVYKHTHYNVNVVSLIAGNNLATAIGLPIRLSAPCSLLNMVHFGLCLL